MIIFAGSGECPPPPWTGSMILISVNSRTQSTTGYKISHDHETVSNRLAENEKYVVCV
jgi:hypothetical protein